VPSTNGILASPARVRVEHYLKGNGPAVVTVQTAIKTLPPRTTLVSEDGIRPRAGERWRIYASSPSEPYSTSICLGSHRLPARTKHFFSPGAVSFDYPATWHARTYPMPPAPFSTWLVWLSPQPMHPPCVTRHGTHNTTITCTDPLSRLRPDSFLAYWTSKRRPRVAVRPTARGSDHGRRPARKVARADRHHPGAETARNRDRHGRRAEAGWQRQLVPTDRLPPGPDTARLEAQIKAMLRSVHWLG
jgi:hypothetical protein